MGESMDHAACRLALGNLWTSLRAVLDALPPHDARPMISADRSVLREITPSLPAMARELERLCLVAQSVLHAKPNGAASERLARSIRHLKADLAIAVGTLRSGSESGVVLREDLGCDDAPSAVTSTHPTDAPGDPGDTRGDDRADGTRG